MNIEEITIKMKADDGEEQVVSFIRPEKIAGILEENPFLEAMAKELGVIQIKFKK